MHRLFWNGFKNFAILFSFITNLVLIIVLLVVGIHLFTLTDGIVEPLVDGLHGSFIGLDDANIIRQISVQDSIPVEFPLTIDQSLAVTLVEDVVLTRPATFNLPGGGGIINGTVDLVLPQGLQLPIALLMTVEVEEMVPVNLLVDVEIPLDETQLHGPFFKLKTLLDPFVALLDTLPGSWGEAVQEVMAMLQGA